ncbi:interleukin-1 receptor-like 1 [Erinaceus europaeus]|uniref:Interleukin-1 receptor-like 1 n=1 Tax=Erinaceus europaeus TaxID=9365 RepID=A0ABM3X3I1_ERIEU|nr:interleukin-1 receptor-like 1 [Erinaceus europaeus]XP_060043371.1 interleukin-1 receptor-like 1 [Erinaceus europaeus]
MKHLTLAVLTILIHSTTAKIIRSFRALEKEALIVTCSRNKATKYPVDWYSPQTNKSITTQKTNRVFASGKYLKFLPSEVTDTGVYTCIVKSPTFNQTGYVDVTIYKKQPGCNIPNDLIYSTTSGSEKNSKLFCPTINWYNWTAPIEWLKNCKPLQGPKYYAHKDYLVIDGATSKDSGDYMCRFVHNENGSNYTVTATRSFIVKGAKGFTFCPVITAPAHNETKEVEIGGTVNITCSVCFGRGAQLITTVQWRVNNKIAGLSGEGRFQEEEEQNKSSSNDLVCVNRVLRITDVKEEDLLLKYDCLGLNLCGQKLHTIRLKKKLIDHQSIYYLVIGFSILLMLLNVLVIMLKVFWIDVILFWRDIMKLYKTRDDGKLYDAYIIYPRNYTSSPSAAGSVEYFVHQVLPDVLENKCGYNLCIYGRDLLPGEDVATAVETNIRKSRRHIFILTPQVMHSKEFAFEQEIALHSTLIQNDSKAILIEMETLSKPGRSQLGELQDSLKHLMKVQGTIKWRDSHISNKNSMNSKFWKHVRYHMPVPNKLQRKTSTLVSLRTHW